MGSGCADILGIDTDGVRLRIWIRVQTMNGVRLFLSLLIVSPNNTPLTLNLSSTFQ